ncbi:hypothetical protein [Azospira oryzae]|uniref:hypothetical protein n=1 Tax=Azospira oryzae TaxID=146939 RepID=UPI0012FEBBE9|nr:hypothetical protein [Azospira oryzae]
MKKQKILELPFPSTSVIHSPVLCTSGGNLVISMDFDNEGQALSARLKFIKQRAFRKRSESYCTDWHIVDVYDTVCEVEESDWVSELRVACPSEWRDQWTMRHFMIYLDSFGCVEVIAESALLEG